MGEVLQMKAFNKKKTATRERVNASSTVDNKSSFGVQEEFVLRLRDDPTLVSELTGQLDEYTLEDHREWHHESSNTQGTFSCSAGARQFDEMVQGFLRWFMTEEEAEESGEGGITGK